MGAEAFMKGTKKRRGKEESEGDFLGRLTHITLKGKGITQIENLELCRRTQVLYLYDNQIARIENLGVLTKTLSHLYLQNNQIQTMEGLDCLPNLTKLYLDGNQIQRVEGLQFCPQLEELHLSNQQLPRGASVSFEPESMATLQRLSTLNATNNNIMVVMPLCHLQYLQQLDLSCNGLIDFQSLLSVLNCCCYIGRLEIKGNPICKQPKTRETIIMCTGASTPNASCCDTLACLRR